jgi:hypothetical protein
LQCRERELAAETCDATNLGFARCDEVVALVVSWTAKTTTTWWQSKRKAWKEVGE